MLDSPPKAAAATAATAGVEEPLASTWANSGGQNASQPGRKPTSSTPLPTRSALIELSSLMRGLSTTARILIRGSVREQHREGDHDQHGDDDVATWFASGVVAPPEDPVGVRGDPEGVVGGLLPNQICTIWGWPPEAERG